MRAYGEKRARVPMRTDAFGERGRKINLDAVIYEPEAKEEHYSMEYNVVRNKSPCRSRGIGEFSNSRFCYRDRFR